MKNTKQVKFIADLLEEEEIKQKSFIGIMLSQLTAIFTGTKNFKIND